MQIENAVQPRFYFYMKTRLDKRYKTNKGNNGTLVGINLKNKQSGISIKEMDNERYIELAVFLIQIKE